MIVLRADAPGRIAASFLIGALLIGAAQAAATAPAFAQAGPPLRLTPGIIETAPTPPATPAANSAPAPGAPAIEVGQPAPIDTGSVGLSDAAQLGLPADPWKGSARPLIDRLIAGLPANGVSRPLHDLSRRLLIAAAPAPAAGPARQGEPARPSFISLRAARLMAMGDVDDAASLARLIPSRNEDATLARVLLDAAFEGYDNSGACTLARTEIGRFSDEYWQKALIFCQALASEQDRAQLGLSMLRDQSAGGVDDDAFVRLVASLGGDGKVAVDRLPTPTPLHLAMMRAARLNLPADVAASTDPVILRMVARSPNASDETRLLAAERAEAYGVLPAETLGQIYDTVSFTPEQFDDPMSVAQNDKGPRGRAVFHRAAKRVGAGAARAELLQRGWRLARERGGYATAVRVDLPPLLQIVPDQSLMFFAPDAVRALLLSGRVAEARAWYALTVSGANTGNELAATARTLLDPLFWLADPETRAPDPLANAFEAWRQAQEKLDPAAAPRRAGLLAVLLVSTGHRPEPEMLQPLMAVDAGRDSLPMPSSGLWLGLGSALEAGRAGETALLVANMLGPDGAAGAAPQTIGYALDGLRAVNLDSFARSVAVETAIAGGL